jgi:hypothetical protein
MWRWFAALMARPIHGQVAATNVTTAELEYAAALGVVGVTTDTTTLDGLGTNVGKWTGMAYAPSVGMLYAAPFNADSVLMINPRTNVMDTTTLGGLGAGDRKWIGMAYASSVHGHVVRSAVQCRHSAHDQPTHERN